ncbi:TlpA family protein disulfide reductase [Pseudenhygromyxa sp. WMMC2535]|uniref:peroxiredoxin family protein n=1 Tax=Pseudenhygromyxa sp. WMMC2535 TaxID=2712867 RepID=UPI0015524D36|nr:TlpA disulfide reductase family protein [Pseudenhygromyxa sp. WMMC2535]NVB40210.1 TlpA family protein disulfide reductase [Pseudenhygromyxa sp. WMMC2535]
MATSEIPKLSQLLVGAALSLCIAPSLGCDKSGGATAAPSDVYADLGITLTNLEDDDVTIVSQTADDVHVLAFWATWCVPCTGELAKMKGIYDRLHDRGLNIYAISIDGPDTISRVPGFASEGEWPFPVLYDPETQLLARYNPKGDIPFYVILDADGNIIKSHQGYVKGDETELEQFLTEQLPAPAAAE